MPPRKGFKRRRSQAFLEEEQQEQVEQGQEDGDTKQSLDAEPEAVDDGEALDQRLQKERDVWAGVREEYYEIIEQIPLTLHRQYSLMRELDEQTHGYMLDMLPMIHKYIERRRELAKPQAITPPQPSVEQPLLNGLHEEIPSGDFRMNGQPSSTLNGASSPRRNDSIVKDPPLPFTHLRRLQSQMSLCDTPRTPTPMGIPAERTKTPETTREMLSHIAWLLEELVRAGEEKVNIAQTSYDSVDRHIRQLDQAIKEQETYISLGVRSGTHVSLPDLVQAPGRYHKPTRAARSPELEEIMNSASLVDESTAVDAIIEPQELPVKRGKGKGRGKLEKVTPEPRENSVPLKIILPAMPSSSQEKYCTCNRVAFGDMVACENKQCPIEWYHIECVGLPELPAEDEDWFCPSCVGDPRKKGRRRRK